MRISNWLLIVALALPISTFAIAPNDPKPKDAGTLQAITYVKSDMFEGTEYVTWFRTSKGLYGIVGLVKETTGGVQVTVQWTKGSLEICTGGKCFPGFFAKTNKE